MIENHFGAAEQGLAEGTVHQVIQVLLALDEVGDGGVLGGGVGV